MTAVDAGAEDVQFSAGIAEIYTSLDDFHIVRNALEEAGYTLEEATVVYEPNAPLSLESSHTLQVMGLIEKLEELDDVESVYSTLDISEEALATLEAGS
jgi:transcriptional/translational regulatory protein YebC/TACO1